MTATTADPRSEAAPSVADADATGPSADPEPGTTAAELVELDRHETGHWQVAGPAALLAAGIGIVLSSPGLVLAAIVAVGLLAYRQASTTATPAFAVERSVTPAEPDPGDVVAVETTVRNVGDGTVVDCRLVDLVPEDYVVVEGSPRIATALRPGEARTMRYEVRATRGTTTFDGVHAVVRDLAGTTEDEYRVEAETVVDCVPSPLPLPATVLRSMASPYAGRLTTDQPGEGLEFHATREYRPGDALRRIDWNQFAATGDLATLQFRTERAAQVVLLADVREDSYVRADPDAPHAADRVVDAVGRLFVTLLDADHRVGLATVGPDYWLAPSNGSDHRVRGLQALGSEPALSERPTDHRYLVRLRLRQLRRRLPDDAQLVLCTPLTDDTAVTVVRLLESYGHQVSVVAPAPTGDTTPGETLARLERQLRIATLREAGVPVVDWPGDQSLAIAIARTATRWSE